VPSLRPRAAAVISRMVGYLDRNDWNAYRVHSSQLSIASPMIQTPSVILAFTACGNAVDPVRFGPLFAQVKDLAGVQWLGTWVSSRDVMYDYYGFNLGHGELTLRTALETDPARYREYVKELEILRDVIGDHQNAWFDAVNGAVVPAAAPVMGPLVANELQHWALRPRRAFSVHNSSDPAIAQTSYTGPMSGGPQTIAAMPLPIEKRPATDFLWQRDPFSLDGGGDGHQQYCGVDLVLPYWQARAFGMIK
jgi:hypothetical protein